MIITIKSKEFGEWHFWMSDGGGHIICKDCFICEAGHLAARYTRDVLKGTPKNFRAVCRDWLEQHCRVCSWEIEENKRYREEIDSFIKECAERIKNG